MEPPSSPLPRGNEVAVVPRRMGSAKGSRCLPAVTHRSSVAAWERGFLPPHRVSTPTVASLPLSHGPTKIAQKLSNLG